MKILLAITVMAITLACTSAPKPLPVQPAPVRPSTVSAPVPTPAVMPSPAQAVEPPTSITLSMADCRTVIVHIPYDPEHVEETTRTAAGAAALAYPFTLTIADGDPKSVDDVGQIVAWCYRAVHNEP